MAKEYDFIYSFDKHSKITSPKTNLTKFLVGLRTSNSEEIFNKRSPNRSLDLMSFKEEVDIPSSAYNDGLSHGKEARTPEGSLEIFSVLERTTGTVPRTRDYWAGYTQGLDGFLQEHPFPGSRSLITYASSPYLVLSDGFGRLGFNDGLQRKTPGIEERVFREENIKTHEKRRDLAERSLAEREQASQNGYQLGFAVSVARDFGVAMNPEQSPSNNFAYSAFMEGFNAAREERPMPGISFRIPVEPSQSGYMLKHYKEDKERHILSWSKKFGDRHMVDPISTLELLRSIYINSGYELGQQCIRANR